MRVPTRNPYRYVRHRHMPGGPQLLESWVADLDLDSADDVTHSMRRAKATLDYRWMKSLRAAELLLGHTTPKSTQASGALPSSKTNGATAAMDQEHQFGPPSSRHWPPLDAVICGQQSHFSRMQEVGRPVANPKESSPA